MHGRDEENKERMNGERQLKLGNVAAELEETKQSLSKAKEESMVMAHCLSSLQEELEKTKKELQLLKERELSSLLLDHQPEDVKLLVDQPDSMEFQKKRYVTFANPPTAVPHLTVPPPPAAVEKLDRLTSIRREKNKIKKTLIPLISSMFSKKKGN
ncbi:WEB family protein [Cucumis melo var. makuwa]|nr:WEB family protein [Cucumis melo var. makuwa]TYK31495.1 WEB family protein [Cucumis melo var. makuwa]